MFFVARVRIVFFLAIGIVLILLIGVVILTKRGPARQAAETSVRSD